MGKFRVMKGSDWRRNRHWKKRKQFIYLEREYHNEKNILLALIHYNKLHSIQIKRERN